MSQDKSVQGLRRRNLRDEIFRWRSHCGLLLCRCPFPFILHFHLLSFSARREMFKIRQVKRPFTSTLCVDLGTIWLQNLNEFSENFWKSLLQIYLPKKVQHSFSKQGRGGQRPFGVFPKIHPNFVIQSSLNWLNHLIGREFETKWLTSLNGGLNKGLLWMGLRWL